MSNHPFELINGGRPKHDVSVFAPVKNDYCMVCGQSIAKMQESYIVADEHEGVNRRIHPDCRKGKSK